MRPKISVVIPCYNEEKIIFKTYKEVKSELDELGHSYEIIFCNDGSTDKTLEELNRINKQDQNVNIITYCSNRGLGYAYRQLFEKAQGEIIVTMDADLAMVPKDTLPLFLTEINYADIVVASRYAGSKGNYPVHRLIPSKLNLLFNRILFKIRLTDTNSGFYAIRKVVLEEIRLISDGFEVHPEFFVKAIGKGFKIKEMPVKYSHIIEGELNIFKYGPKTALDTLRLRWRIK